MRKLAQVGRGEYGGCACPLALRFGKQSWVSRHQGLALALTGISGHVHAADLAPGGCGGTQHLGLTISLRPALPEGLVPSFSLWSHTPWECSPLASNASRARTLVTGLSSSRFSDQREACSGLPTTTESTVSEAR